MDPPSSIGAIFESKTVQNRREIGDFRIVCFVSLSACGLQILQFEMGKKRRNIEKKKEVWDARRREEVGSPVIPWSLRFYQKGELYWEVGPSAARQNGSGAQGLAKVKEKVHVS